VEACSDFFAQLTINPKTSRAMTGVRRFMRRISFRWVLRSVPSLHRTLAGSHRASAPREGHNTTGQHASARGREASLLGVRERSVRLAARSAPLPGGSNVMEMAI